MLENNNQMKLIMDTFAISNPVERVSHNNIMTYIVDGNKCLTCGSSLTDITKREIIRSSSNIEMDNLVYFYFRDISYMYEDLAVEILADLNNEKHWERWALSSNGTILDEKMCKKLSKIESNLDKLNAKITQEQASFNKLVEQYTGGLQNDEDEIPF